MRAAALLTSVLSGFLASAAGGGAPPAARPPFLKALDLSYLPVLDCSGACSPFRAAAGGPAADALALAAAAGVNAVRLRLWVDPSARTASPWPPGNADYTYANLTGVLAMARRLQAAGLLLWLDLHYSDVWADPGHQTKPAAWSALSLDALVQRVGDWTRAALAALAAQGTPPAVVAVGNEITAGMLWSAPPQPCAQGGALFAAGCAAGAQWTALARLVAAGCAAVRAAAPAAAIQVHTDLGNRLARDGAGYIATFYQTLAAHGAADWDEIGLSFYPQWGAGNTSNVRLLGAVAAAFPGKRITLAETAYPHQDGSPGGQFPYTPAGQAAFLSALIGEVRAQPWGGGVAYWGGEFYNEPAGSGWAGLWGADGVSLPALTQPWRAQQ